MIIFNVSNKKFPKEIRLPASKSLSNRALIIRSLCVTKFIIENLSNSSDTLDLNSALEKIENVSAGFQIKPIDYNKLVHTAISAGQGGTSFRFLLARLAFSGIPFHLEAEGKMKERPIGILVDSLAKLGAQMKYLGEKGFPPVQIDLSKPNDINALTISAKTSSQFISALLMIAPTLPRGLNLFLDDSIVSETYINLTVSIMNEFGIKVKKIDRKISVPNGVYEARPYWVESDWSSAGYIFGLLALMHSGEIYLPGLKENSIQGDSVIKELMTPFGITTTFDENGAILKKSPIRYPANFTVDCINFPDLAPTLIVLSAALGIPGEFFGLSTLAIKESNRIMALKAELQKVDVFITHDKDLNRCSVIGKADLSSKPIFDSHNDHRIALSLSLLGVLGTIKINEPDVVKNHFPGYWELF